MINLSFYGIVLWWILNRFAITHSQQIIFSTPWRPCSEFRHELRLPCRCLVQQYNNKATAIHMDCDRVVFIGSDVPPMPFGAPIVSFSQRWSGRQILPSQFFTTSGLPLSKVDFSGNAIRRLTEKLLFNLQSTLVELRLADNLLGDSLNPIFSTSELHGLTYLKVLDLSGNQIKSIEEGIFKGCENLQELYLHRNSFTSIPSESLNGPKNLKLLSLRENRIDSLKTKAFHAQKNVEFIDLSYNVISSVEQGAFSGMERLKELLLRHNQLSRLNSDVFDGASNLDRLDLSQNYLTDFPQFSLKVLRRLKMLNVSSNLISNIDSSYFVDLELLDVLDLSRNNIANLAPGMFLGLKSLKYLDLSVNTLRAVEDDAFEGLTRLTTLRIRDNNILLVPASAIARLPRLTSINLEYNRITAISNEILTAISSNARSLSLSQNIIRELPSATFQSFKYLEVLDLSKNLISVLNSDAYTGLEETLLDLDLSQNRISNLVGAPLKLRALQAFDLSSNKIAELPRDFLSQLPSLLYLNISHNTHLNQIPVVLLQHVDKLQVVDMSNVGLKSLSSEVFLKSTSLEEIYLQRNAIPEVPEHCFVNMKNLTIIDLSHNRIASIRPSAFINLMNIRKLVLAGNLLNAFKGEIFNTGTSLEILDLSNNQLSYITQSSFKIHPRLQKINLSNNKFSFFPADLIASLQYLEEIDLSRNLLKQIDELDFARLPRLRQLLINHNLLESISEMSFHNSTQLQILDLSNNKLDRLGERTFEGLARLEMLNLDSNSLSDLPETIFDRSKLYMLENIKLANNSFEVPPLKPLQKQYFFLNFVDLSHNKLVNIPPDDIITVNIKRLDLSFNPLSEQSIKNIISEPKTVRDLNMAGTGVKILTPFETPFLKSLNLSFNNITELPENTFGRTTLLESLDLSHNRLSLLNRKVWPLIQNLQVLNISYNPIEYIVQGDFDGLANLQELNIQSLQECTRIEKSSLDPLKKLTRLNAFDYPKLGYLDVQGIINNFPHLTKLNIEFKDGNVGSEQLGTLLNPQLESLGLYGSRLQTISSGALSGLKSPVVHIKIQNTSISTIPPTFFFSIPRSTAIILDVSGSQVSTLSPQLLAALDDRKSDFQFIGLDSNPLVCDCNIRALRRWLLSRSGLSNHYNNFNPYLRCSKPEYLQGRYLIEIGDDELSCDPSKRITTPVGTTLSRPKSGQTTSSIQYGATSEPDIIWSVPPTTPKRRPPASVPPVITSPTTYANDDTLIIGIVGGVLAFIIILIIIICIIRLRMPTNEYAGGPMMSNMQILGASSQYGGAPMGHLSTGSTCACSVGGGKSSLYAMSTVAPPIYATSTLPHRPASTAQMRIPMYATMGSRNGSIYSQQVQQPYLMMMPPDEKIYR